MKLFELSNKEQKNGRRHFKAILYTIFPDNCVDEVNQVGTKYNINGITWLREYCEKALPSIKGMSLRCEFINEERTELLGHGDTGIVDGEPVFEDAVVIGNFTDGYIEDIETDDGIKTVCIGEGEIDAQCYHNFITKLEVDVANGDYPNGSIEIMHMPENESIVYKYGYKEYGRIPTEFIHSGYALLGISPADSSAKLIELNKKHKEDTDKMNELEIKNLVSQAVGEFSEHISEINQCKAECDAKIAEINEKLEKEVAEKNEVIATSEQIKAALEECKKEYEELNKKYDELWAERAELEKALGEAKARERLSEMDRAIADFSEEEKEYAKEEIEEFKENPVAGEINTIVSKIWEGIGKNAKKQEKIAEQNAAGKKIELEDIFSEVIVEEASPEEDMNIF